MNKQLRICDFLEKSCEEEHHEKCAYVYEGGGIRAICRCNCHQTKITDFVDKKEKLSDANQIEGRLDISEGVAIVTKTNST